MLLLLLVFEMMTFCLSGYPTEYFCSHFKKQWKLTVTWYFLRVIYNLLLGNICICKLCIFGCFCKARINGFPPTFIFGNGVERVSYFIFNIWHGCQGCVNLIHYLSYVCINLRTLCWPSDQ